MEGEPAPAPSVEDWLKGVGFVPYQRHNFKSYFKEFPSKGYSLLVTDYGDKLGGAVYNDGAKTIRQTSFKRDIDDLQRWLTNVHQDFGLNVLENVNDFNLKDVSLPEPIDDEGLTNRLELCLDELSTHGSPSSLNLPFSVLLQWVQTPAAKRVMGWTWPTLMSQIKEVYIPSLINAGMEMQAEDLKFVIAALAKFHESVTEAKGEDLVKDVAGPPDLVTQTNWHVAKLARLRKRAKEQGKRHPNDVDDWVRKNWDLTEADEQGKDMMGPSDAPEVSLYSPINPGDEGTAPHRVVLHPATRPGEWVVHYQNTQTGGFSTGFYTENYQDALKEFKHRCAKIRVDHWAAEERIEEARGDDDGNWKEAQAATDDRAVWHDRVNWAAKVRNDDPVQEADEDDWKELVHPEPFNVIPDASHHTETTDGIVRESYTVTRFGKVLGTVYTYLTPMPTWKNGTRWWWEMTSDWQNECHRKNIRMVGGAARDNWIGAYADSIFAAAKEMSSIADMCEAPIQEAGEEDWKELIPPEGIMPSMDQVTFKLIREPERDINYKKEFKQDPGVVKWISDQLAKGNRYAWFSANVEASWFDPILKTTVTGNDYLGGCSYRSAKDFMDPRGYWPDMKQRSYEDLLDNIRRKRQAMDAGEAPEDAAMESVGDSWKDLVAEPDFEERWIFTAEELEHPEECKALDRFVTPPVEGHSLGVIVYRTGIVTSNWEDGTSGVTREAREFAQRQDVFYKKKHLEEPVIADNWREVYVDSRDGNTFKGWVQPPEQQEALGDEGGKDLMGPGDSLNWTMSPDPDTPNLYSVTYMGKPLGTITRAHMLHRGDAWFWFTHSYIRLTPTHREAKVLGPFDTPLEAAKALLDSEPDRLKESASELKSLLPGLAVVAQQVYDEWEQDDEGESFEYGVGGICQDIAEAMAGLLSEHGIEAVTVDNQGMGEQHVWVVAKLSDGVYTVDIEPHTYETGGGYCWKKRPGVTFGPEHIYVSRIDADPGKFEQYIGEGMDDDLVKDVGGIPQSADSQELVNVMERGGFLRMGFYQGKITYVAKKVGDLLCRVYVYDLPKKCKVEVIDENEEKMSLPLAQRMQIHELYPNELIDYLTTNGFMDQPVAEAVDPEDSWKGVVYGPGETPEEVPNPRGKKYGNQFQYGNYLVNWHDYEDGSRIVSLFYRLNFNMHWRYKDDPKRRHLVTRRTPHWSHADIAKLEPGYNWKRYVNAIMRSLNLYPEVKFSSSSRIPTLPDPVTYLGTNPWDRQARGYRDYDPEDTFAPPQEANESVKAIVNEVIDDESGKELMQTQADRPMLLKDLPVGCIFKDPNDHIVKIKDENTDRLTGNPQYTVFPPNWTPAQMKSYFRNSKRKEDSARWGTFMKQQAGS